MISKTKRILHSFLPVAKDRVEECNSCGDCCKIDFVCHFLKTKENGTHYCSVYLIRPLNCRKYPRIASEMEQHSNCGYSFPVSEIKRVDIRPKAKILEN